MARYRRLLAAMLAAAVSGAVLGCGEDEVESGVERRGGGDGGAAILVRGSKALAPPAKTAAQGVAKRFRLETNVEAEGTAEGFDSFCTRGAAVVLADRTISAEEASVCKRNGIGFARVAAGFEAVAVYAAKELEVRCLETSHVRRLFAAGEGVARYDELDPDLPRRPVRLIAPVRELGGTELFVERALNGGALSSEVALADDPTRFGESVQEQLAVGYFGVGLDRLMDDAPPSVALDAGSGCVRPSLEAVRAGRYALARPLFIYATEEGLDRLPVRTLVVDVLRRTADTLAPGVVPLDAAAAERSIAAVIGVGRGAS